LKARLRARTRARRRTATMHRKFFLAELQRLKVEDGITKPSDPAQRTAYQRAQKRAERATVARFPKDFRRLYLEEIAAEGITLQD
jgi:hypothetical protein